MAYNYKYKMEWVGLKNHNANDFYYRLEFYKKETNSYTYEVQTLTPSNAPFTLSYRAKSDYFFEPFRASTGEINIVLNSVDDVSPNEFFIDINNDTYKVIFKLIDVLGSTETELWKGFLVNNDIQYEWQYIYPLRLSVSDNLPLLKEFNYTDPSEYKMYESADLYTNITIKDFIIRCLNYIGLELDVKFAFNFYNVDLEKNETSIYLSEYSAIDWSKKTPYDLYTLLDNLLSSLGCILYQDNRDASWTILNPNEVSCNTNNTVPYRKYDYTGTEIETGDYDISGSININNDVIWSDANQIVTLRERFDSVYLKYPYIKKNLIQNYNFFKDAISSSDFNYWVMTGGYSANLGTNYGVVYNPQVLNITNREDKLYPVDGTMFASNVIDFSYYRAENTSLFANNAIVINFDYTFTEGNPDDGFNISFYSFNTSTGKWNTFDSTGTWYENTTSDLTRSDPVRIDCYFSDGLNIWTNFNAVSKFTYNTWFGDLNQFQFYVRGIRTDAGETPTLRVTNFNINVVPNGLTRVKKFNYVSTQLYTQSEIIPTYQLNTKIIESKYHTGTQYGSFSSIYFDDCLMILYNDGFNDYIDSNNYWSKSWQEHNEGTYQPLNCLTASSILSFYRGVGRVFTGNVYAEQTPITTNYLAFPMYLEVNQAINEQALSEIYTNFNIRVTSDGGTIEDTTCGADFISEFYQPNSKFFMHEASFDYFQNKTLVNIQEDFTNTDESRFLTTVGQNETTTTSNIGEPGSNSNNTQNDVTGG